MGEVARALQLQPQRLRVDLRHHLHRHRRVARQQAGEPGAAELAAAQRERRVEALAARGVVPRGLARPRLDVDGEALAGLGRAERVGLVHPHQGGDVESLVELVAKHGSLARAAGEDIRMTLSPGNVLDVGDDRLDPAAGAVEAVVEADRVEGVAEVAQAGEQADRAGGAGAGRGLDGVERALGERAPRVAEEVGAPEPGRRRSAGREQREGIEHLRQLDEVEVHEEEPVAKAVLDRLEAPVPDPALVHGRGAHAAIASTSGAGRLVGRTAAAAISAQARMALSTPSSWKPQPQ